ncbi:unnamed protein product [Plutella xylostella]|uniref:(diamondback moth) hypothetical protein n=1 Tax=Plutella xylostella TaxID=51655 RepID=A0A8S4FU46_PLUXY|nr:unnamed protein product [Plutella xylostella]
MSVPSTGLSKLKKKHIRVKHQKVKLFRANEPLLSVFMWGVNHTINELSHVSIPVMLLPDDFRAYSKLKVDNHLFNKENMPSHFKVKEYCPLVFRNLRERFGIDDLDYKESLTRFRKPDNYLCAQKREKSKLRRSATAPSGVGNMKHEHQDSIFHDASAFVKRGLTIKRLRSDFTWLYGFHIHCTPLLKRLLEVEAMRRMRVQYNHAWRALFRLPYHCSASGMFAAGRAPGWAALLRRRSASTRAVIFASDNPILCAVRQWPESPLHDTWRKYHVSFL